MSSWNYRVMRHAYEGCHEYEGKTYLCIHEVYYDDDDKITGWTESASSPFGESAEELARDLALITKATLLPILDFKTGLTL